MKETKQMTITFSPLDTNTVFTNLGILSQALKVFSIKQFKPCQDKHVNLSESDSSDIKTEGYPSKQG